MSIFFILCVSIGILQVVENIKLLYQKGEQLLIDRSFSFLEFCWLLVAIWFLYQGGIPIIGVASINVLISYHVFGWLVAMRAYKLSDQNESDTIVIPLWYFKISICISLIFSILSYITFKEINA
jgi:hypothetical protein